MKLPQTASSSCRQCSGGLLGLVNRKIIRPERRGIVSRWLGTKRPGLGKPLTFVPYLFIHARPSLQIRSEFPQLRPRRLLSLTISVTARPTAPPSAELVGRSVVSSERGVFLQQGRLRRRRAPARRRAGVQACRRAGSGASQRKKTCAAFVGAESQFQKAARAADTTSHFRSTQV